MNSANSRQPLDAPLAPRLPRRIPSLDGIRGASILVVVFAHTATTRGCPAFLEHYRLEAVGGLAVRFFFIISGFLITTLLLRELDENGRIGLRRFYLRRALRIFPAAFAYIGIIYACYLGGLLDLTLKLVSQTHSSPYPDLIQAITYTANYRLDYNWYLNHLWSLSVEEQFYCLWPVILFFFGVRRSARGVTAVVCLVPLIRGAMYLSGYRGVALTREFQAIADALATGCLLCLFHNRLSDTPYVSFIKKPIAAAAGSLGLCIGYGSMSLIPGFGYVFGQTIANFSAAILLDYTLRNPGTFSYRFLNTKVMCYLGILSYSLYLWQEPFLFFKSTSWVTAFPQNVVLAFAAATVSYYCIERPFLRWRSVFSNHRAHSKLAVPGPSFFAPPELSNSLTDQRQGSALLP